MQFAIDKLNFRLEEEIQQNEYYVNKMDELDIEVLEERL